MPLNLSNLSREDGYRRGNLFSVPLIYSYFTEISDIRKILQIVLNATVSVVGCFSILFLDKRNNKRNVRIKSTHTFR